MKLPRNFDLLLCLTALMLCIIGLLLIYSVYHPYAGRYPEEVNTYFFNRQLLWICFGILAMIIGMAIPFRIFETLAYVFYTLCIALLIAVLIFNKGDQAHRWLSLGPVKIQPSEFTKIALLFVLARLLSGYRGNPNNPNNLLFLFALFIVPFILIINEPDLGTAVILCLLVLPILYWRGISGLHIFFILTPIISTLLIIYGERITENPWPFGIFIVLVFSAAYFRRTHIVESLYLVIANLGVGLMYTVVWTRLQPYQQERIMIFLDPRRDELGDGWQVLQSKIAIGSGGVMGKGYLAGTQKALEFLPARHTDFIFSVLGEELGFLGALVILGLFFVIIYKALGIAAKSKSDFAGTVCIGIAAYFFFQIFINVGMATGILPVTGMPLPFLSYGGSSLVVSMFMVGFLLNASMRWYEY